jgi:nitrous oxidase accessory protein NosD
LTRLSKSSIVVLVVFLLLLLPGPQAAAAGEVSNITKGLSYDSIQEAIDAADSGDIIELAAGTYAETDTVVIDKPLTLRSASGAAAVIEGEASLDELISVESPGVVLEGLTITGGHSKSITVEFDAVAFLADTSTRSFSSSAVPWRAAAAPIMLLYCTGPLRMPRSLSAATQSATLIGAV